MSSRGCRIINGVMRRRTPWSRAFAALFALWIAALLGDPGTLHSCAMHGGVAGHGVRAGHAPAAAAAHHVHDAHASERDVHHAASHDSAPSAPSGPCTCIGHCCAVAAVAPLPTLGTLVVPVAIAAEHDPLEAPRIAPPAAPDLRLPFANGPPTV